MKPLRRVDIFSLREDCKKQKKLLQDLSDCFAVSVIGLGGYIDLRISEEQWLQIKELAYKETSIWSGQKSPREP